MNSCSESEYLGHERQIPRLNRIIGQIEGIKKMIADRRRCPDILIQFKAVKSAVKAVEREVLDAHLSMCVSESFASPSSRDEKIREIKNLIAGSI
jgi:DNA-binding FrmR family transcriptional regulator